VTTIRNHPRGSVRSAVLAALALPVTPAAFAADAAGEGEDALQEITVTATRREESLSKVPISIAAISQKDMDSRGLKEIDGLARFTPGLVIDRQLNGGNNISIRGISSGAGAGTTGIYIDDTPIQVRNLAYSSGNAFPALFDLERVEVLRGPQGTLFGAGSQGGTVRFIQPAPSLTNTSTYIRGEFSSTDSGDPSYEIGAAYGAPIIEGKVGFRVSVFHRTDGGYIDGVTGTPVILDPTGAAGPASLTFQNVRVTRKNTNSSSALGARAALKWQVTENLEITPSVTYQQLERDDGYDGFWSALSSGGNYARLAFDAGDPATHPLLTRLSSPDKETGTDEFVLPALQVNWDLGPVSLVSNTSYFDRTFEQNFDFTRFYMWFYGIGQDIFPADGEKGNSLYSNGQRNFVQEVRLQSNDPNARLTWVVGAFYSEARQTGVQDIGTNFLNNAPVVGWFFLPPFLRGQNDGDPGGPGSSAFFNWFGVQPEASGSIWSIDFRARDTQLAGFVQTDFKITEKLKLITGVRVSDNKVKFSADYASPENNQNSPLAGPGPVLTPLYSTAALDTSESAVTPKVGLSYQMDDNNLFYATAAKGFRPPGASQRVPVTCDIDVADFGYVDGSGNPQQPLEYKSDTVWSYEVGSKNRLLGGRLAIDASAYQIKWKDIQTSLFLPTCFESFVANTGEAKSEGFDLGLMVFPLENLSVTANIGYNRSKYTTSGVAPSGAVIVREGSFVQNAPPPWVYAVSAQYDFSVAGSRKMYVRSDVTYSGKERLSGATDPTNAQFDAEQAPIGSYSIVSARVGTQLFGADVSLFANNLTNENPDLLLNNSFNSYSYTNQTLRPRTFGLSVFYRY
jgi:outer membrane receptor protein involved in Fe transport